MVVRCRKPNDFGGLLIYQALAQLVRHWVPLLVLLGIVIIMWRPNMCRVDRSLARYAAFDTIRRGTRWFIPFIPWRGPSAIRQSPRLASLRCQRPWRSRDLGRVPSPNPAPSVARSTSDGGRERRKP